MLSLLCHALCTADAQDEPRITQEIWPEIKRVGMTGYLNCTVTRQSNNKVCQRIRGSTTMRYINSHYITLHLSLILLMCRIVVCHSVC